MTPLLGLVASVVLSNVPQAVRPAEFRASVQAWTFNRYSAFEAIEKTAKVGAKFIELFPDQRMVAGEEIKIGPSMGDDATQRLMDHLAKNGLRAIAYGVTGIPADPSEARKLFAWAKKVGIEILNTESVDAIDTIETMVKEFDMRVGFHNHPRRPNDATYRMWDPKYVLSVVEKRDARIGSCADTGHWVRSGIKPVDALKVLKGRIVASHLKDLNEFSPGGHDVPFGTGVSDIPSVLTELRSQGFTGSVSIEYEYDWEGSMPEVAQCIGFLRAFSLAAAGR
ncbi:MAG: sugar phosphate isomerase/epimerase [Fimbriimonadaceae bacterium]|nr:sugar phosphate isomerase/epimerase [Fimbriimonadaceae bacterium]